MPTRACASFTLTPPAGKTVNLDENKTPTRIGETNVYRFRISGDFLTDGSQSVTVVFTERTWSFFETAPTFQPISLGNLSATNGRTYLDAVGIPLR